MADFSDYQDLVNPGGFIVFDDYQFSRVKNGVNKTVEGLTDKDNIGKFNIIGDIDKVQEKFADKDEIRISKFDASKTLLHVPQINSEEVEAINKFWSFYLKWPKFMFPFFKWLEKDTKFRRIIYKILIKIENKLKTFRKKL